MWVLWLQLDTCVYAGIGMGVKVGFFCNTRRHFRFISIITLQFLIHCTHSPTNVLVQQHDDVPVACRHVSVKLKVLCEACLSTAPTIYDCADNLRLPETYTHLLLRWNDGSPKRCKSIAPVNLRLPEKVHASVAPVRQFTHIAVLPIVYHEYI